MAIRLPVGPRRAMSLPIRAIPFPILGGPNKGSLWSLAALGRGVVTGRYEVRRFRLFERLIDEGDCVWDVGAHRGYATLIAASRVGDRGSVVAFEPASVNRWYLERHTRWNRATNVRVCPFALGASDGRSTIGGEGSSVSFAMGEGSEPVQVRSLDSLVARRSFEKPTLIKIDVEGFEYQVLRGAREALESGLLILLSVHSRSAYEDCARILRETGFRIYSSPELRSNRSPDTGRWHGDPDLVALGEGRSIATETLERFDLSPE